MTLRSPSVSKRPLKFKVTSAFQFMCRHEANLIHATFPEVCELEEFQIAKVVIMITEGRRWYYSLGHI